MIAVTANLNDESIAFPVTALPWTVHIIQYFSFHLSENVPDLADELILIYS